MAEPGKKPKPQQGLTPKQRRLVVEYLKDHNATQAAIRAGYAPAHAHSIGPRLVRKSRIRKALRRELENQAARLELKADEIVREMRLLAFSRVTHYWTDEETGELKLHPHAPFEADAALSAHRYKKTRYDGTDDRPGRTETLVEYRLWDKLTALKFLAEVVGLAKPPELPPLEALFAALPAEAAGILRGLIVQRLSAGSPQAIGGPDGVR